MVNNPLISVITICYNEEKKIEKTCKSVANQTSKNFEWVVVDGSSTDNTYKILKKYKEYMNILISEKDSGVYNAMNKGIKLAKGEYLLFLNGGDELNDKEVINRVNQFILDDKKSSSIYYGDLLYDNGEIVTFRSSVLNKKFFVTKTISHQATFIEKSLFKKFGNYNERYRISSDFDFWVKTIVKNKVRTKYLPLIVSVFDQEGISTDYKKAKQQIAERNNILLNYGIITSSQEKILKLRGIILALLKKSGLYFFLRKIYRRFVNR